MRPAAAALAEPPPLVGASAREDCKRICWEIVDEADLGWSHARCRRCQAPLDIHTCAAVNFTDICDLCRLEEWVRGRGQTSSRRGGVAADRDRSFGWVNASHWAANPAGFIVRWTLGMPRRMMRTRIGLWSYITSDVMSSPSFSGDTPGQPSHHGLLGPSPPASHVPSHIWPISTPYPWGSGRPPISARRRLRWRRRRAIELQVNISACCFNFLTLNRPRWASRQARFRGSAYS